MIAPRAAIFDWQLERYRLGELPGPELDAIRTALAKDGDLAERLAGLDRSDLETPARPPAPAMGASIRARAASGDAGGPRRTSVPPRLALALACGLVLAATGVL